MMQSKHSKNHRCRREAFTLVEVMLVLFILTVMATMTVGAMMSYRASALKREATIFVRSMKTPLEIYANDHGHFPYTAQCLDALLTPADDVDPSKGTWPYIDKNAVKTDPWGQPYQYLCPGQRNSNSYDIWSLGPDGVSDSADDIGNW